MPVNATFHHDTLVPATKPTIYFIGVTTGESSIRRVFPRWAERLGLGDTELAGVDLPLHADPEHYRRVVEFIKADPLSVGALVTTHKIDLFHAASDLFDAIGPMAALTGEVSCLSKPDHTFTAEAKDPISCGLAADRIVPPGYWQETRADAFVLGAGGSAIAISWYLARPSRGGDRPRRIIVSNRSRPRLERLRQILASIGTDAPVEFVHSPHPHINDAALTSLAPGSLVVNATGLGKDAPGSPLTDAAVFPSDAIAWDLNYRGDLVFMEQARAASDRGVRAVDGWDYFLHGWTQVISEVYHVKIPTQGPDFDALSALAAEARG
jgi:shikimate 5-dehydrogenase